MTKRIPAAVIRLWVTQREVIDELALKSPLANSPEIPQKVQAVITMAIPNAFLLFMRIHSLSINLPTGYSNILVNTAGS